MRIMSSTKCSVRVSGGTYHENESKNYHKAKEAEFRDRIELYTTLNLVGDLTGKRVIDVACGSGWLTRALKDRNALQVVGSDLSSDMISLAKAFQTDGIEYIVEDAREALPGNFDVVASNWLLVNARDRTELASMCNGLAGKLKSGGRLVTVVTNPKLYRYTGNVSKFRKYGLGFKLPEIAGEGAVITISLLDQNTGDSMIDVENYYFSEETYISQLESAGFVNVKVHPLELSPHPSQVDDSEYWEDFLKLPLMIAITGVKK